MQPRLRILTIVIVAGAAILVATLRKPAQVRETAALQQPDRPAAARSVGETLVHMKERVLAEADDPRRFATVNRNSTFASELRDYVQRTKARVEEEHPRDNDREGDSE